MKLDTEKKVLLCQKALYTKQLVHYRELCAIYQDLANIAVRKFQLKDTPNASVSDQVQEYYGKYLTLASNGDLSFLEHNGTTERGFLTSKFDADQKRLFKNYAKAVNKVSTFKTAAGKLHNATYYNDKFDVDPDLMDEYHEFMQSDPETQSFDKFIAENSKRWIGHISYRRSASELEKIKLIDSNHIAVLGGRSITPKSFGATITGARGNVAPIKERLANEFEDSYTIKEHEEYDQEISASEKLRATAYKAGYHSKESLKSVYTANQGTLKKALKRAAIIGVSLALVSAAVKGVNSVGNAIEYSKTSAYTNTEAGYVQTIDDDTMQTLRQTDELIGNLKESTSTPSKEDLFEVRDALDEEIDLVIEDLVRSSFHEQYPNLIIPEGGVETHYDKADVDPVDGQSGNYIYITCNDINGKTYNYTITEFGSEGIFSNRTKTSFDNEYSLDYEIPGKINSSDSKTYDVNTKTISDIIAEFEQIHEETLDLAGSAGSINIPQAAYDNAKAVDKEGILDMLKAKYSKVSIFALKPRFDLVTPEKTEIETTHVSPVIEKDGDER